VKPVIIHSQARAELEEAIAFYEEQRPGLGLDLQTAVERAIGRIQQNSQLGARYKATEFIMSCDVSRTSSSMRSWRRPSGLSQSHMGTAGLITGEGGGLNEVTQATGLSRCCTGRMRRDNLRNRSGLLAATRT
jgi:hypothetical protein